MSMIHMCEKKREIESLIKDVKERHMMGKRDLLFVGEHVHKDQKNTLFVK